LRLKRVPRFLAKSEFESIMSVWDKLRAFDIVKEGSRICYDLVLKILTIVSKDE